MRLLPNRFIVVATVAAAGSAVALTTAAPATAATPTTHLQATVLKISGKTLGAGATIPVGTALQQVTLTSDDPDSGPQGPLGLNNDPTTLVVGEAVTLKASAAVISQTVPAMRATALATDAGTFTVLVFSVSGNSYALPQYNQSLAGVTRTTAASTLNVGSVSSIVSYAYGLLPGTGTPLRGNAFTTVNELGLITNSTGAYLLYDADTTRGNGPTSGDEVILTDLGGAPSNGSVGRLNASAAVDVLATVQFANGSTAVVRAVKYSNYGPYYTATSYLFDRAALSAVGQSVGSVAAVLSSAASPHGLNWSALGFA